MEEYLIIENTTKALTEKAQARIQNNWVDEMVAIGYTEETAKGIKGIPDGTRGIRGKIQSTGEDDPRPEAVTWMWDEVKESIDGTFYITARKEGEKDDKGKTIVTKEKPFEWDEGDDLPELYQGETVGGK